MKKIYLLLAVIVLLVFLAVLFVLKPFDNIDNTEQLDSAKPSISDSESETDSLPPFEQAYDFLEEIESSILEGYQKTTDYESDAAPLATLEYLPEGFIYAGIYTKKDPGTLAGIMVTQLWYDPDHFEMLTITQSNNWDAPNKDSGISYSFTFDSGKSVNETYSWAECYYTRELVSDGVCVYLYMLANANTNQADCFKILNSSQIKSERRAEIYSDENITITVPDKYVDLLFVDSLYSDNMFTAVANVYYKPEYYASPNYTAQTCGGWMLTVSSTLYASEGMVSGSPTIYTILAKDKDLFYLEERPLEEYYHCSQENFNEYSTILASIDVDYRNLQPVNREDN